MKEKLVREFVVKKQKPVLIIKSGIKAGPPFIIKRDD